MRYEIRREGEQVNKQSKKVIGNLAINLGKYAVGKSIIPGMYDPKIPAILKTDSKRERK